MNGAEVCMHVCVSFAQLKSICNAVPWQDESTVDIIYSRMEFIAASKVNPLKSSCKYFAAS